MTMKVRALLVGIVLLVEMWLVGCGHYTCGTTFGASSCSSSGGGLNQGGGGGTAKGTYLLIADAGGIQGEVLDPSAKTISITPGFGTVSVDTNVPGDWMVIAGQKFMYSAYTATGEIWGWSLNGNGTLTALTQPIVTADFLLNDLSAGSQAMIANPAGTLLFGIDQTNEQIEMYQIGTAGGLTGPTTTQLPSGFKPFNLAIDGLGKYLYVSNVSGLATTEVAAYSIGSSGTLTAVGSGPMALNIMQMQGEASGKFMVGTSGGDLGIGGNLYVASIDQSTGALTATLASTVGTPVSVAVQPNTGGNLVYAFDVANSAGNGTIEGFTIDTSTGTLTAIAGVTATGANGEFDPAGKYLFVVASSNGVASSLDAFDVTASSALANPLATVGWAPGAWASFDAP